MNIVQRVIAAHEDVNGNWFAKRRREEQRSAIFLIVSAVVACSAIAVLVMSVVTP